MENKSNLWPISPIKGLPREGFTFQLSPDALRELSDSFNFLVGPDGNAIENPQQHNDLLVVGRENDQEGKENYIIYTKGFPQFSDRQDQ